MGPTRTAARALHDPGEDPAGFDLGSWGDDANREDPLTTVIAAELLARTDPSFDLVPTRDYALARR